MGGGHKPHNMFARKSYCVGHSIMVALGGGGGGGRQGKRHWSKSRGGRGECIHPQYLRAEGGLYKQLTTIQGKNILK